MSQIFDFYSNFFLPRLRRPGSLLLLRMRLCSLSPFSLPLKHAVDMRLFTPIIVYSSCFERSCGSSLAPPSFVPTMTYASFSFKRFASSSFLSFVTSSYHHSQSFCPPSFRTSSSLIAVSDRSDDSEGSHASSSRQARQNSYLKKQVPSLDLQQNMPRAPSHLLPRFLFALSSRWVGMEIRRRAHCF